MTSVYGKSKINVQIAAVCEDAQYFSSRCIGKQWHPNDIRIKSKSQKDGP